jgi:hypothetical protein
MNGTNIGSHLSARPRHITPILLFLALGVAADFTFNGLILGFLFKARFTEQWIFIYAPLYFALAMGLSNILLKSKWRDLHVYLVVAFVVGTALGHLSFVGIHRTQNYTMNLDTQYNDQYGTILLRSSEYPQILLVTSPTARDELTHNYMQGQKVPVALDILTDYGCNRSNAISTVAGIDVQYDNSATWAWQKDNIAVAAAEEADAATKKINADPNGEHRDVGDEVMPLPKVGPGHEDQNLFWCWRPGRPKWMDDSPYRPWDRATPEPNVNASPKAAANTTTPAS